MKQTSGYCGVCERRVYATGRTPNHVLHVILSVVTVGVWVPVWLVLSVLTVGNYRCTNCGERVARATGHAGRYGSGA